MNQSYRRLNSIRFFVAISFLLATLSGCKKEDTTNTVDPSVSSQTDLLVANNWHTIDITTPDGQSINKSRLDLFTQSLFSLNMQFRNNGRVNALDPNQSNSVVNGGTWLIGADKKSIDVDVTGFKGNFPIVQLTKNKLILRQDNKASIDGKKTDIYIVFDPVI